MTPTPVPVPAVEQPRPGQVQVDPVKVIEFLQARLSEVQVEAAQNWAAMQQLHADKIALTGQVGELQRALESAQAAAGDTLPAVE